jgi:hypothetical protein
MPQRIIRLQKLASTLAELAVEATELGQPQLALSLQQVMTQANETARGIQTTVARSIESSSADASASSGSPSV